MMTRLLPGFVGQEPLGLKAGVAASAVPRPRHMRALSAYAEPPSPRASEPGSYGGRAERPGFVGATFLSRRRGVEGCADRHKNVPPTERLAGVGTPALLVVAGRDVGCSSEGEGDPPPSDASPSPLGRR